jgi:DNA (cytosine-5)-methyltransferase 1
VGIGIPEERERKMETMTERDLVWLGREDHKVYEARKKGLLRRKRKRFRLVDVFAGAGGMTLGFTKMGGHAFDSVWASDFNAACVETYRKNFGAHCVLGDIVDVLADHETEVPLADVVIGGPPCQGFSLLNRNRESDPRKQLWKPFFEVVDRSKATTFVMENVPQLLKSLEYNEIVGTAEAMGFKCWSGVLLAADYGVPQTRRRAFIVGCKFRDPSQVFPPRMSHFDPRKGKPRDLMLLKGGGEYLPGPEEWRTVRNAIEGLPHPKGKEIRGEPPPFDLHFGRSPTQKSKARYRAIPDEGMNRFDLQERAPDLTPGCWLRKKTGGTDLFGRLWWDRPAFTIRTEFFKPEKGRYLHPKQHRPITHREAARLQSFPDGFCFSGAKIEIAKQIGNAVPPLLASRVADLVYLMLSSRNP